MIVTANQRIVGTDYPYFLSHSWAQPYRARRIFDLLNENVNISRSSNQNYIEDKSYNVLKRFWQLSFTYNTSRFAGKNTAPFLMKKDNIQVIRSKG